MAGKIVREHDGDSAWLLAPVFGPGVENPSDPQAELSARLDSWRGEGFVRVMVDRREYRLDEELPTLSRGARLDLVLDRVKVAKSSRGRIAEAVEQAEALSDGRLSLLLRRGGALQLRGEGDRHEYSTTGICPECGFRVHEKIEPRHFSFNTHVGACEACDGLGEILQCDTDLLVTEPDRPLIDGAITGKLGRYLVKGKGFYEMLLREVARSHRIDITRPFERLTEKQRALLAYGKGARKSYTVERERHTRNVDIEEEFVSDWPGLCGHVDAWYQKAEDPGWRAVLEPVMRRQTCRACEGERLKPAWRSVRVGRKRLPEVLALSVDEALSWLEGIKLKKAVRDSVAPVLEELSSRISLLARVGLGYLTLERRTRTLSGGEARRVRLSASLGSQLVGVSYVLDEPTVGLHPQDDIQVITPMRRGELGVANLNEVLQKLLNPDTRMHMRGRSAFKNNDKVMQIRNNYDREVFNGDIGRIVEINPDKQIASVKFEGRTVLYPFDDLDEPRLAYAITVHKSQGSEYPAVILPMHTQHYILLQRNLFYTALTRGKKLVCVVGSHRALGIAINNNKIRQRFSGLRQRLMV